MSFIAQVFFFNRPFYRALINHSVVALGLRSGNTWRFPFRTGLHLSPSINSDDGRTDLPLLKNASPQYDAATIVFHGVLRVKCCVFFICVPNNSVLVSSVSDKWLIAIMNFSGRHTSANVLIAELILCVALLLTLKTLALFGFP